MRIQLPIVTLSLLGLVTFARVAHACDCIRDPAPARSMSDVIFVGRVTDSRPLAFVELEVRATFKGQLDRRVRIPTGQSDCDYFLPPIVTPRGSDFLVYGRLREGKITVSRCSDPGPVDRKILELQQMRQSRKRSPLE